MHVRERHPVDALVGEGAHLCAQQARLREKLLLEAGAAEEDAVVDGLREARADPAEDDVVALALGRAALDEGLPLRLGEEAAVDEAGQRGRVGALQGSGTDIPRQVAPSPTHMVDIRDRGWAREMEV